MDDARDPTRPIASSDTFATVEITAPVPSADVPAVAKRVAARLWMSEARVRRLIDARVGPITKPLRAEKAETLRRVLEREGVSVTTLPFDRAERPVAAPSPAPRWQGGFVEAPPTPAVGEVVEFPDAFVSAVLAGMIAVILIDGPASGAELRAVRQALESMTGTDVGGSRIETLARSRGAGDLRHAQTMLAALEPSLSDEQRRAGAGLMLGVVDAGAWSDEKARGAGRLVEALGAPLDAARSLPEHGETAGG
jgi:hypothetical protein